MRFLSYWSIFVLLVIQILCSTDLILAAMPSFDRPSENVTVIIGNAAILPCFINNLGDHKVCTKNDIINLLFFIIIRQKIV